MAIGSSAPARGEWLFDLDAGARYESNLTRAQQGSDIRADTAATLAASAGSFTALSGANGLTLSVNAKSALYHRFHGLNYVGVGATAAYRHKFGVGWQAPWLSLTLDASHDDFASGIRDGDRLEWRAEIGRRFTEAFDASFGALYDRRYARDVPPLVPGISGNAFSVRGQSAFVRAAYALTGELQLGVKLLARRGDIVSTTRQNLEIFEASDAIAADPSFGNDFFAYRLRGTTATALIGLSWALSDRSSINLTYADERTRAYDGLDYRGRVANFVFAYGY